MKKVIFIGKRQCGKTSLIYKLKDINETILKTQTPIFVENFLDTPGEYLENQYYSSLITSSYECNLVILVQRSDDQINMFPSSFNTSFNKKVIGIVLSNNNSSKDKVAAEILIEAGAEKIFNIDLINGNEILELKNYINNS